MMNTQPSDVFYQIHDDAILTQASRLRVLYVISTSSETKDKYLCMGSVRWLRRLSHFLVFHVLNVIFGVIAFALVATVLALSVVLIPISSTSGFRSLGLITDKLAQLDVRIANLIIEDHSEKLTRISSVAHAPDWNTMTKAPLVVQPNSNNSKSLNTLVPYFATAKLAVSALGFLVLAFIVSFLTSATSAAASAPDIAIVFVLSNVLLVVLAIISRELTESFCATSTNSKQRRAGCNEYLVVKGNDSLERPDSNAVI